MGRQHLVRALLSPQGHFTNGPRRSAFPLQLGYYLGQRSRVLLVDQADWGRAAVLRKQVDLNGDLCSGLSRVLFLLFRPSTYSPLTSLSVFPGI